MISIQLLLLQIDEAKEQFVKAVVEKQSELAGLLAQLVMLRYHTISMEKLELRERGEV